MLYIKGKYYPQDLEKAKLLITKISSTNDFRLHLLEGLISYKENKYTEAIKHFQNGTKAGDIESIYHYGKMLFLGEGTKKNIKEAIKIFNMSKSISIQNQNYKKKTNIFFHLIIH